MVGSGPKVSAVKSKFHCALTLPVTRGSFGKVGDLARGSRGHGSCYGKVAGMFWDFSPSQQCRDGLKNSRDNSATSPFASGKRGNRQHVRETRSQLTLWTKSTGTSRVCCGRHGEVGIVEFGLNQRLWICSIMIISIGIAGYTFD